MAISRANPSTRVARSSSALTICGARARAAEKRGGGRVRITLDERFEQSPSTAEDVLAVHEALNQLDKLNPRQATIVELRYFSGMTAAEVADVRQLDRSPRRLRTRFGGLFLFLPYLARMPFDRLLEQAGIPKEKLWLM